MFYGTSILLFSFACLPKEQTETAQTIVQTTDPNHTPPVLVRKDGTYPKVDLEKEEVVLTIIQSNAQPIEDIGQAKQILRRNSEHMVEWGKKACAAEQKPDIILFHEFPLSGYFFGNRDQNSKWPLRSQEMKATHSPNLQKNVMRMLCLVRMPKTKNGPDIS